MNRLDVLVRHGLPPKRWVGKPVRRPCNLKEGGGPQTRPYRERSNTRHNCRSVRATGTGYSRSSINPENPTQVAVLMDVADMDALTAAMQSEAAAETMAHDGVVPESLVILIEE